MHLLDAPLNWHLNLVQATLYFARLDIPNHIFRKINPYFPIHLTTLLALNAVNMATQNGKMTQATPSCQFITLASDAPSSALNTEDTTIIPCQTGILLTVLDVSTEAIGFVRGVELA